MQKVVAPAVPAKKQSVEPAAKAEQKAALKSAKHSKTENAAKKSDEIVEKTVEKSRKKAKIPDENIIFGNIEFSGAKTATRKLKGSKKERLEKALKRAESEKSELAQLLPAEQVVKQTELAAKKALLKAKGVKIRDDPILIKKSLKAQESKKSYSTKRWANRKRDAAKVKVEKASAISESLNA
jgi:hypothetical protein